jgi:hypothetical protein
VVEVFDSGGDARHRHSKLLGDVIGGGAVGVGRLDQTQVELDPGLLEDLFEIGRDQRGHPVAVHQVKVVLLHVVVDEPVGVSVDGAAAHAGLDRHPGRELLLGLDVVGSALESSTICHCRGGAPSHQVVQLARADDGVVEHLDLEPVAQQLLKVLDLLGAHAVGAVVQEPVSVFAVGVGLAPQLLERPGQLGVVAFFSRLAVHALGVLAGDEVVQLGGRDDAVVDGLARQRQHPVHHRLGQAGAARPGVFPHDNLHAIGHRNVVLLDYLGDGLLELVVTKEAPLIR